MDEGKAPVPPTGQDGSPSDVAGHPAQGRTPLHDPDPYGTPPYGRPGPWAPAPPVQHPAAATPPHGTRPPSADASWPYSTFHDRPRADLSQDAVPPAGYPAGAAEGAVPPGPHDAVPPWARPASAP
ncbi:protease, partial [Streptomyces sp. SCA2-4]|nr:protease [Streptomyces huiliensis]